MSNSEGRELRVGWGGSRGAAGDCSALLCGAARLPSILGLSGLGWGGVTQVSGVGSADPHQISLWVYVWISLPGLRTPVSISSSSRGAPHRCGISGNPSFTPKPPPKWCVSPQHPLKVGHPITAGGGSAAPPHPQPPGEGREGGGGGAVLRTGTVRCSAVRVVGAAPPHRSAPHRSIPGPGGRRGG